MSTLALLVDTITLFGSRTLGRHCVATVVHLMDIIDVDKVSTVQNPAFSRSRYGVVGSLWIIFVGIIASSRFVNVLCSYHRSKNKIYFFNNLVHGLTGNLQPST